MSCIFCMSDGPYTTVEHIIPESLGNTENILTGVVCDKCQNYFGKEVESYVLSKSPFAFWRVLYNLKSKKGKSPYYDTTLPLIQKGSIPDTHIYNDNNIIFHPANISEESIVEVEINDKELQNSILSGNKNKINIMMTPKMLIQIGRFLGKMALEFLYKAYGDEVFDKRYDDIRKYARYGTVKTIWPVLHSSLNKSLINFKIDEDNDSMETRTLYRYGIYDLIRYNTRLFIFDIGQDRFGIILDEQFPDYSVINDLVDNEGNKMEFIWYRL
ncbi:HNH endonuclease [Pelotomaculum terephthalicicum JT]|uniref:HNH endonuclease n=1 Tax=Pelotomaculum terephthalicicum TaxID=206393 RepID=UPI001F0412FA|nr:HNH endonuclease [Pelotomaculum terephthalicicum]MCG9968388.1 HNH endonuclease [Pelotomaculum terephthalicicum JT]